MVLPTPPWWSPHPLGPTSTQLTVPGEPLGSLWALPLSRSLWFLLPLCTVTLSSVLPCKFHPPVPPQIVISGTPSDSLHRGLGPCASSKGGKSGTYLACFPSLRSISCALCCSGLKNCCYVCLDWIFHCPTLESKSGAGYLSWWDEKVQFFRF